MKICMVLEMLFPPIDERPYKEAKSLIRNGHEVTLICLRGEGQEEEDIIDGIRIRRAFPKALPYFTFLSFGWPATRVVLSLRKERFDVFHIHNPPDSLVLASLYGRLFRGAKVVMDFHDPVIPGLQQNPERYNWRGFWAARFWEMVSLKLADRVIVVSDGSRERLVAKGVPDSKITMLRNYVNLDTFDLAKARPQAIRDRYELGNKRVILYTGTVSPIRGLDVLIKAVARLKQSRDDLALIIVGNTSNYSQELQSLAEDLGMGDSLLLLGWQPLEEMPNFMAAADICVEPRKYSYHTAITGNSNKLYQYMAMEKPIVATTLPSLTDFIDDSCAVLVPPDDPDAMAQGLQRVLDNPALAATISENAYQRAIQEYNWGLEEAKLLNLYSEIGK
ncbi:MAG: glycosyltransferase family 4 protein [Chloroflexi bacterium]|nr:glycosyltransferase family 4 protein [Chloroflexota bacterium]